MFLGQTEQAVEPFVVLKPSDELVVESFVEVEQMVVVVTWAVAEYKAPLAVNMSVEFAPTVVLEH